MEVNLICTGLLKAVSNDILVSQHFVFSFFSQVTVLLDFLGSLNKIYLLYNSSLSPKNGNKHMPDAIIFMPQVLLPGNHPMQLWQNINFFSQ